MFYIFAPGPHTQNLGFSIIISIRPVYAIDLRFMYDQPDRNGKSEQFHSYDGIPQVRNRNSDREKFSSWASIFGMSDVPLKPSFLHRFWKKKCASHFCRETTNKNIKFSKYLIRQSFEGYYFKSEYNLILFLIF